VNGVSGDLVTSIWDSLVRLPALEPGQSFVWQRTYVARADGNAWRHVRVERFDQAGPGPLPESQAEVDVQPAQADLQLEFLEAPTAAQESIPILLALRVRNLGPSIATRVKVAVTVPDDAMTLGGFAYGPRTSYVLFEPTMFQTQLLPGESASAGFVVTPVRTGAATGLVQVHQADQLDPNPENDIVRWTFNIDVAPPIPPFLRVRKVRTDFFDQTSIAEIEIDQAALNRYLPYTPFYLERSSNLRDWEPLRLVGYQPLAPVTFTDQAGPESATRMFRLRN
jgi:hypothetical protein